MNTLFHQMILSFYHVISEESGNDVTIARTKTMVALVSLTWPEKGITVSHQVSSKGRIFWNSPDFDSLGMGGSFRRDPVGDDASLGIDEDEAWEMIMVEEMKACASFIPLYGRQSLERFNRTLAGIFDCKNNNAPLSLPGSEESTGFPYEDEYRSLFVWLLDHQVITPAGAWQTVHS